jgi:hypothetical protein
MWRFLSVVVAGLALLGASVYSLATPGGRAAMYGLVATAPQPSAPAPLTASVEGTVTLDGHPLPFGMVHLVGQDGRVQVAPIHQGKFRLPQAPVGEAHVAIEAPPVLPIHPGDGPLRMMHLPRKYRDPRVSGLTGNLVEGMQSVSLDLRTETEPDGE